MPPGANSNWRISAVKSWSLDRPRVLAIINTTPDSFSDGGLHASVDQALAGAVAAIEAGADGLDIGGESTRPRAPRVSEAEQVRRTIPAIRAIRARLGDGPVITIDTTRAQVARAALDAGADAINDVAAGADDPSMLALAAASECGLILMHRLVPPERDVFSHQHASPPDYGPAGVVAAVESFLRERTSAAIAQGVVRESILIDPGLGFGKSVEQNLELIAATPRLLEIGFPLLSGVSRKSFVARAAGMDMARPPRERAAASVGLSIRHMLLGARVFRVHDVAEHIAALRAAASLDSGITNRI